MAQADGQKQRNWRAGATANKSREDQQPAGVLGKRRLGAVLHGGVYRESDGGCDGLGAQARLRAQGTARESDAGQLAWCDY
jgi:hypothetical protein